jgi:hypothetical protein
MTSIEAATFINVLRPRSFILTPDKNLLSIRVQELKMKLPLVLAMCSAMIGVVALSSPVIAQQKTVKACEEEWRANKAANQAAKITEKAYVEKCRAAAVTPTTAAPAKPAAVTPAKPATATPATTAPKQAPAPATAATGANQYTIEAQAKARCPSDTVVYVNLSSKIYHFAGHKDYGNLKNGAYMCEKETAGVGARAAKNEKHP